MISRRKFLASATAAYAAANLTTLPGRALPPKDDVLQWADPRIGTGGHGHTFPGASVPFGAMQLSPDTFNEGWDWCSGYHISDASIMGFSHTHLSGTGAADLLDFLVTPGVGEAKLQPGDRSNPESGYRSRFRHETEVMSPGYYAVTLDTPKVRAELTATERVGVHRYTFPASGEAYILIDLHHAQLDNGKSTVVSGELEQTGPDSLGGGHITNAWGHGRHAYFALQVSKQPKKVVFFKDDAAVPAGRTEGANLKAVMFFDTHAGEQILVKTGYLRCQRGVCLQTTSRRKFRRGTSTACVRRQRTSGARSLARSARTSSATRTRRSSTPRCTTCRLDPRGSTTPTASTAAWTTPSTRCRRASRNYTTFSLWDTFRAAHPAYTLLEPERVPQFVNTLIRMAEQSPAGAPVWPLHGRETECMTGYHSTSVIAEACNKGIGTGTVDYARAYQVLAKRPARRCKRHAGASREGLHSRQSRWRIGIEAL